jgi:hypothetical protein
LKIIKSVRANADNYTVAEVNCFEKPIAVAVDSYKKGFSHFYYLYIKMIQAYEVNGYKYAMFQDFPIIEATKDILPKLFGFQLKTILVDEDIQNSIIKEIDCNRIVFVQGNLRELFYTNHYKCDDWNHLFLIKGYDETKKLYYINDAAHILAEDVTYMHFILPFEIVHNMFNNNPFNEKKYINSLYAPDNYEANIDLAAKNFLKEYFEIIDTSCLKEELQLQAFDYNCNNKNLTDDEKKSIAYELKRITANKKVFFNELLLGLSLVVKDIESLNNIKDLTSRIISLWEVIINRSVINAYNNRENSEMKRIKDVKALEFELFQSLSNIYNNIIAISENGINSNSTNQICSFTSTKFYLEYNDDNIINFNNHTINFCFNNGKTYNTWDEDASPKIMFDNTCYNPRKVELSARVRLLESSELPYLMAGIVLRDLSEKVYYFGICNAVKIVLDLGGINGNICNHNVNQKDFILKVRLEETKCSVLYAYYSDNPEFILINTVDLNECIKEIGIGCKTWQEYEPISVEFSDVKITPIA